MKVDVFNRLMAARVSRRRMLQCTAGMGAIAAGSALGVGRLAGSALAQGNVRAEILRIPGVGQHQSEWYRPAQIGHCF